MVLYYRKHFSFDNSALQYGGSANAVAAAPEWNR
jgi:hypothetical protein